MKLRVPLSDDRHMSILSVYAPTLQESEDTIMSFYGALRGVSKRWKSYLLWMTSMRELGGNMIFGMRLVVTASAILTAMVLTYSNFVLSSTLPYVTPSFAKRKNIK